MINIYRHYQYQGNIELIAHVSKKGYLPPISAPNPKEAAWAWPVATLSSISMADKVAVRQLPAIDPSVKVIVSSGYSNDPTMAEFAHHGFNGVVAKPYQIQQLSKILHKVIG